MSLFDLLPHQKQIVREMVKIYEETGVPNFVFVATTSGRRAEFEVRPTRAVECVIEDLHILGSEGLVQLRIGNAGYTFGSLRQAAVDAVTNDFKKPAPTAPASVYQTFYAPVGAVNTGPGRIETVTQNVGIPPADVAEIISQMRGLLDQVPAPARAEAAEHLEDLETELRSNVPKQSRIKSSLLALWSGTRQLADFGHKITAMANAYGIDTSIFG